MQIQVSLKSIKPAVPVNATVKFSHAAAMRVKQLIAQEGNPALKFRVTVSGGGCSGFQYGFGFDEQVNADDTQINTDGVVMLVDTMSMQYLANAEVDFLDGLEGSRFVINNPNAKSTCGCGSSFSL
jgi:iron-sulfur cluster insertion protein